MFGGVLGRVKIGIRSFNVRFVRLTAPLFLFRRIETVSSEISHVVAAPGCENWQPTIKISTGGPPYRRERCPGNEGSVECFSFLISVTKRWLPSNFPVNALSPRIPLCLTPSLRQALVSTYPFFVSIDNAMATSLLESSPTVHSNLDGLRDHPISRTISPDQVSVMSSQSQTFVENLEEGFVKKSHPKLRWFTATSPPAFKGTRPCMMGSYFHRWRGKQQQPVPKLLSFAITASITVMLVPIASETSRALLMFMYSVLASLLIYYIVHLRSLIPQLDIQKTIASWGLSNYPTQSTPILLADFSRDIIPIPCHSHNDYWRHVPLYDALAAGCTSVEADVWLSGNDLFVGHSQKSLTKDRTLESLYIDPIVSILSIQNTPSEVTSTNNTSSISTPDGTTSLNGVFEVSPKTPLILLIDMKTDGALTFPAVLEHLEPFRSRGWLTYFNGSAVIPGLITVVGTGNTPFELLVANTTYRDIFYDAPLEKLWGDDPTPIDEYDQLLTGMKYTADNSYYASVSFQKEIGNLWHGMLTPQQVLTIRGQVRGAEERGLKARYWDTPAWPVGKRDHVWDVLMREGVGALNVDDLEAAKERNWGG